MAKETKPDMSCARVKQYKSSDIGAAERHNERKNSDYENINVVPERIGMNVHYRSPTGSYMDVFREMEANGTLSTRGLRQDATLFDEIIIDVNTMYFERNGGYEYAKKFYEEAYHFLEKKFGSEYVVSAVMHADEINKAASEEKRRDIYQYHLHAIVIPVVEKEILWSKRCKDLALRGTVKEVIHQVSHSKKWASNIPMVDENGNPVLRKMKHPNVEFTTDGKGKPYEHGQDNTSIAVAELSLDEELLEKAIQISDEDGADIAFLTEEELEEHIEKMEVRLTLKNSKNILKTANRMRRILLSALMVMILCASMSIPAFAADDPLAVVNNLSEFIFGLIRAVGLILLGWGIVQVGLSFQSHDPSQRSNGFLTLAGGIVSTFAKEILSLITG